MGRESRNLEPPLRTEPGYISSISLVSTQTRYAPLLGIPVLDDPLECHVKTTIDRIVHRENPWRRRASTLWIKDADHGLFLCRPFRRFYGAPDVARRRLVRRAVPVEADSEREGITYDAFTKDRSLKRRPSEADSTAVHPAVSFRRASPYIMVPGVRSGARIHECLEQGEQAEDVLEIVYTHGLKGSRTQSRVLVTTYNFLSTTLIMNVMAVAWTGSFLGARRVRIL